jgi:hypothetical protein
MTLALGPLIKASIIAAAMAPMPRNPTLKVRLCSIGLVSE